MMSQVKVTGEGKDKQKLISVSSWTREEGGGHVDGGE